MQETGEIGPDDDPTLGIPGAGDLSHVGGAPAVSYEALLKRLQTFTDIDVGDTDASLIGEVVGQDRQNMLAKAYQDRRSELAGKGRK